MDDPDFEALKALPDEELQQIVEEHLKKLNRHFQTLHDEGDMGYVRFMSEKLMAERDMLEATVLDRMEQMMKRTMKKKKNRLSKRS